jgi:hypothetical protein
MTWANIYFLNGGLRKVVVTFFQCVKLIFLTTHERTFQPTLRGVEKLVSKWGQGVVETELNSAVARFFQSMLGIRKKQQLFRFLLRKLRNSLALTKRFHACKLCHTSVKGTTACLFMYVTKCNNVTLCYIIHRDLMLI